LGLYIMAGLSRAGMSALSRLIILYLVLSLIFLEAGCVW
jgi:hypothetical protein